MLERRLELEALERTKESEARKRAELLASKQAGRAGYLQRQLAQSPPKGWRRGPLERRQGGQAPGRPAGAKPPCSARTGR
jgi:hypothetical protein